MIESHTKGGAPLHIHTKEDEYFYVVEGKIVVTCGKEIFEADKGSFVFLPKNIPHSWDVVGEDGATLLMITVPAMLDVFLRKYHIANSKQEKDLVASEFGIKFL